MSFYFTRKKTIVIRSANFLVDKNKTTVIAHGFKIIMQSRRAKRTITGLNSLKNMGLTSRAEIKFILDSHPFEDEDNPPSPRNDWLITGRLLLNSPTYKDGAIKLNMIIGTNFPLDPPTVYLRTMVFHPNVTKEGS